MGQKVAIMVGCLSGGGMERVAAQLSVMLSDSGYEVYILVCTFDRKRAYKHKGRVVVFPCTFFDKSGGIIKEIGSLLHDGYLLAKLKRKYQIDFTISCAPEMNLLNMLSRGKDKKILTIHSCLSVRKDFTGLCYRKELFKMYNYSYKVVTVSKWCKQDLAEHYGVRKNKIEVIYNSVNAREEYDDTERKENIILVVGRLHNVKQQWHIIRAFRNVLNEIADAKLVIAGAGENGRYLKSLSRKMKIDEQVVFKGYVSDIGELYQQAKIVAFSSASEAFPCSVIEAISNGVPVVASDCPGGLREVITYNEPCDERVKGYTLVKCGILVPRFDGRKYNADDPLTKAEIEMSKGIIYLLKNESVRKNLISNCLVVSKVFDEKKIRDRWKGLLGTEKRGIGTPCRIKWEF